LRFSLCHHLAVLVLA